MMMGTPLYFSPQLARGESPTPADDVWALGATLYAAVEGAAPAQDRGNAIATLTAIAETRPASLRELAALPGIGARKLELYGEDVLATVGA